MATFHIVSHTHWDREWFEPFQSTRLRLVQLVDRLLEILEHDSEYRCFTLDGQTVVLEDYLTMRPEKREQLARFIASGRILIGPWHILPDEFLVSPESTIRNLLHGEREASSFGVKMKIGYIPDPFGHIGQMPQILQGFGIDTAALQRGLDSQACEIWWQAPDGSKVLTAYLRDGYYNASQLPMDSAEGFVGQVDRLAKSLLPNLATGQVLLMHGDDFKEPSPETSGIISGANRLLDGDSLIHSNLPAYFEAVREEIQSGRLELPVVSGELRSPRRVPVLAGVLSSRMWIKQRNFACETLLEKWASPFSAIASADYHTEPHPPSQPSEDYLLGDPQSILHEAYTVLMQCHPHDSICGCSIDQVHNEMKVRFDQVDQIGESLTQASLGYLARSVDTRTNGNPLGSIVVFNPSPNLRTDDISFSINGLAGIEKYELVDDRGGLIPYEEIGREEKELFMVTVPMGFLIEALGGPSVGTPPEIVLGLKQLISGSIQEYRFSGYSIEPGLSGFRLTLHMSVGGEINTASLEAMQQEIKALVKDSTLQEFTLRGISEPTIQARAVVPDVPGIGYRTLWIYPQNRDDLILQEKDPQSFIENEYFHLEVDPGREWFSLLDKTTGYHYTHLNRFIDGGDAGDEYNYSPPAEDRITTSRIDSIDIRQGSGFQTLMLHQSIQTPVSLAANRQQRSGTDKEITIHSEITLKEGVHRIDIHTEIENTCLDHRLRVHFGAPIRVMSADYDGHFEVVRRPIALPEYDSDWSEQPRPEKPQRIFTSISDGKIGLTVANRGLPEVEVICLGDGSSELALTLLRSVGWLSRGDLATRASHAGPGLPTPGAQMQGRWEFDYSLIPHSGQWENGLEEAYAFSSSLRAIPTSIHPGARGAKGSFIEVDPHNFVLSIVKPAEDRNGIILRGYNLSKNPLPVRVKFWRKPSHCELVGLDEHPLHALAIDPDGSVQFEAGGHKVVTLRILL